MTRYLDLVYYLLIAEAVLGLPAEAVANVERIGLAASALAALQAGFGGQEAYPDFTTRVAVLCWHLVKNHPLLQHGVGFVLIADNDVDLIRPYAGRLLEAIDAATPGSVNSVARAT